MTFPWRTLYLLSFDFAVRLTLSGVALTIVTTCPAFEKWKWQRKAIISTGLLTALGFLLGIWSAPL